MIAITVNEASKQFGVTPMTIYRWIKKGRIQTLPGDGMVMIPMSQFDIYREKAEKQERIWNQIKR